MKRTIIFITIIALLAAGTALAGRHNRGAMVPGHGCGGFGHDDMGPGMLFRWADEIGLDESQKSKIQDMMERFGMERIDKEAELEKAQLKLKNMIIDEAAENDVLLMIDQVGRLKTDLRKMQYSHRQAVRSVLTEEQRAKIKDLMKENRKQGKGFGKAGFGMRDCMGPGRQGDWGDSDDRPRFGR